MASKSVRQAFEKGHYLEAIQLAELPTHGISHLNSESLAYYLGSLAFSGRIEEAEAAHRIYGHALSSSLLIRVRFFLAVSLCRQSRYPEVKALLLLNLAQRRLSIKRREYTSVDEFFVAQGLAFYRFFQAAFSRSLIQAMRAQKAADAAKFDYGSFLAQDLRGHLHAQLQDHEAGLRHLRQSAQRARSLGLTALATASEISQLIYQAERGLDAEATHSLANAIETFEADDTYSKSNLRLELARQLFWRGRLNESLSVLDQASRAIHETRNRRQEALLNLRYADTHLFAGRTERALTHLRFAQLCLSPVICGREQERFDQDLALKVCATEKRILLALQQDSTPVDAEVAKLIKFTGMPCDYDPQTRLSALLAADQDDHNRIARERGLLSFLSYPESAARDRMTIVLDLFPGYILTAQDGELRLRKGLAPLLRKTFIAISSGIKTKQELIETIWGYTYEPVRHDSLIYSTFATLRRLLETRGHWIETSEKGYCLAENIELVLDGSNMGRKIRGILPQNDSGPSLVSQLNYRQIQILKMLKKKNYVTTSICQGLFSVSEITASRDLALLAKLKLVCRIGKGRAI